MRGRLKSAQTCADAPSPGLARLTSPRAAGRGKASLSRARAFSPIQLSNSPQFRLANAPPPLFLAARGTPSSPSSAPHEGSGAPRNAGACEAPLSGWRSRSTRFSRRALPACDRGESPLGAPRAAFSSRRRAALCPRTARSMSSPPSASSWQGSVVTPGGAPAPPECGVTNPPAGAASTFARSSRVQVRTVADAASPASAVRRSVFRTSLEDAPRRAGRAQDKGVEARRDKFSVVLFLRCGLWVTASRCLSPPHPEGPCGHPSRHVASRRSSG